MKEGKAFCVSCGREPEKRNIPKQDNKEQKSSLIETLEKKLEVLSMELEQESDHEKQQSILKSINSLIEALDKIKKWQLVILKIIIRIYPISPRGTPRISENISEKYQG